MATNMQLAKLSDRVYETGGETNDKLQSDLGQHWEIPYTPGGLGLHFTAGSRSYFRLSPHAGE
jgi:hypothetical protein